MDYINGADEESENSIATDETPLSRSDGGATLMNLVSPSGGVKRKASTLMSDGSEEPPTKMRKLNESLDPNQVIVDKSWHEEALKFAQREKDLLVCNTASYVGSYSRRTKQKPKKSSFLN